MTKAFNFIILLITISFNINGQVNIESKEVETSYYNNTLCLGYSYSASLPIFDDSSSFFQILQDSIITIYSSAYRGEVTEVEAPDFTNLLSTENCLKTENTSLNYEIFQNSKKLLSFSITSEWQAGGLGIGMDSETFCFNINLEDTTYMSFESLFKAKKMETVKSLINQKIENASGMEINPSEPYSPYFEDFALTDSTVKIFYSYMPSGSRQFYGTIDIPFKELNQYLIVPK